MDGSRTLKLNILIIMLLYALFFGAFSFRVHAVSVPTAYGQINSDDGAILRKSSSTDSAAICVLSDDTDIKILKEVFKSKTSTSKTKKWYYVAVNGNKGYVRSDLVNNIRYGSVKAKAKEKVTYRKGAGTKMKKSGAFKKNAKITVVLKANPVYSTRGSSKTWYKLKKGSKYYYVCSKSIKLTGTAVLPDEASSGSDKSQNYYIESPEVCMTDEEFEKYMNDQGFPVSYKKKLRDLHKTHPNWGFVGFKTGIDWTAALTKQTKKGTSLVSKAYPAKYRDGSKQYEKGWYKANSKVVAYYMDPRNFLNEDSIYMFEDLSYKPNYQTVAVVSEILKSTKLPSYGFSAELFTNAGAATNVSPVFLASRARQENGNGGDAVNGTAVLGKTVYNPFNIGAFGGTNPLYNGLIYAYGKGWTTPAKAVEGGAAELAENYIYSGQYTCYYQRFNVKNGAAKVGTHQYMTNIMAPYSEALSTKTSYNKYGITGKPILFEIPIYDSMPKATYLP